MLDRVLIDVVQFVEHVESLEAKPEPKLIREKSAKVSRLFLSIYYIEVFHTNNYHL